MTMVERRGFEAVALLLTCGAVALRLLASRPLSIPFLATIAGLAAIAFLLSRLDFLRVFAATLFLSVVVDAATLALVERDARGYHEQARSAVSNAAREAHRQIAQSQSKLAQQSEAITSRIKSTSPDDRLQLFRLLAETVEGSSRGARLIAANGNPLAWWGVDLPVDVQGRYRFDVSNLYVVRTQPVTLAGAPAVLESFERIQNTPPLPERSTEIKNDWITSARFHRGVLRLADGGVRSVAARQGDEVLYVDFTVRPRQELLETLQGRGQSVVALTLALGFITAAIMAGGGKRPRLAPAAFVLLARESLLLLDLPRDRWSISDFEIYGSRIIGPFTRSPLDLLLTAATILAIVILLLPYTRTVRGGRALQAGLLAAASAGFVLFLANLVANCRITPIPDHIAPRSAAEGVLLLSLILMTWALLLLADFGLRRRTNFLLAAAAAVGALIIVAVTGDELALRALVFVSVASIATAMMLPRVRENLGTRVLAAAVAAIAIVPPIAIFEGANRRAFVQDTYAPLVAGEINQLRTMIESILDSEFVKIDLTEILPDRFDRMDLDDLAYVLWSRSSLRDIDIPAVIGIYDINNTPISRFGVGLPQFSDRRTEDQTETLRVGSLVRDLLHHDFGLVAEGQGAADGSVHIVNPSDPGATAIADIYRDFFVADRTRGSVAPRAIEPVLFDGDTTHGDPTLRLPQSMQIYHRAMKPGQGRWVRADRDADVFLFRSQTALYAFPLPVTTRTQRLRELGGVAVVAVLLALFSLMMRYLPHAVPLVRRIRATLGFRTRTSIYVTAVVIVPLLLFVLFVRAYLADRLEREYVERGQTALNTAQRVIEDYLASSAGSRPEQVLDDTILTWLARVIGHDLHLYRDDQVFASSRRDLFSAHIESSRLPGNVYSSVVLRGAQLVRGEFETSGTKFVELYSPITLESGTHYTLALPFILQARQIEEQANDLATTIYLLLVVIAIGALAAAYRAARMVTRPVQSLVIGARSLATGDFNVHIETPGDPDLGLLVTTFREMAQSIQQQQEDLRHERDRLQTLLENINAAVVVIDSESRIMATNVAARRLFHYREYEQLDFRTPFEAVNRFVADHDRQNRSRAVSQEIELTIDSQPRTFRMSIVPLPESAEEMLIAEDVTEILRSNRLEAWAEMARQVAHEIKNPLTPIQLTAEHLRAVAQRDDDRLPAVVNTAVENILRQVTTLRETSKEFSDYASIRQPTFATFDMKQLLEHLVESYRDSSQRGVKFEAKIAEDTPRSFYGDSRMLRGALTNLVENALHAAGSGGTVELTSERHDSQLSVRVKDSGGGVDPELLPKIFDPYFSTKSTGTGLGLAIARKTVEEHGGSISAQNASDGFVITVTLPMRSDPS